MRYCQETSNNSRGERLTPHAFPDMLVVSKRFSTLCQEISMPQPSTAYRLMPEVKIRRESFGGILYKYGCADRGALSFINSPQLIDLLIAGQQHYNGDLSAAIESHRYSESGKQKLYHALDDLVRRGYVQHDDSL